MRIRDWSSDVCSSDLPAGTAGGARDARDVSGEPLPREQATALASAFLPPHKVRNRWDYHYIRSTLSHDPLSPGALRALRGSTAPVLDLGCGLGLLEIGRAHV